MEFTTIENEGFKVRLNEDGTGIAQNLKTKCVRFIKRTINGFQFVDMDGEPFPEFGSGVAPTNALKIARGVRRAKVEIEDQENVWKIKDIDYFKGLLSENNVNADGIDLESFMYDVANDNATFYDRENYTFERLVFDSIANGQFSQAKELCYQFGLDYDEQKDAFELAQDLKS